MSSIGARRRRSRSDVQRSCRRRRLVPRARCNVELAGDYTAAGSKAPVKVLQAGDKIRFTTDAYGNVECNAGKNMRCYFKNPKLPDGKNGGQGILEQRPDGKLVGKYTIGSSSKELPWELTPKK